MDAASSVAGAGVAAGDLFITQGFSILLRSVVELAT